MTPYSPNTSHTHARPCAATAETCSYPLGCTLMHPACATATLGSSGTSSFCSRSLCNAPAVTPGAAVQSNQVLLLQVPDAPVTTHAACKAETKIPAHYLRKQLLQQSTPQEPADTQSLLQQAPTTIHRPPIATICQPSNQPPTKPRVASVCRGSLSSTPHRQAPLTQAVSAAGTNHLPSVASPLLGA